MQTPEDPPPRSDFRQYVQHFHNANSIDLSTGYAILDLIEEL